MNQLKVDALDNSVKISSTVGKLQRALTIDDGEGYLNALIELKGLLDGLPVVVDAKGTPVGALEAKEDESVVSLGSVSSWAG